MTSTKREVLRRVKFSTYRKGMGPTFALTVYSLGERTYRLGRSYVGYRLTMRDNYTGPGCSPSFTTTLFDGEDFGCSPLHSVDSDETVEGIMGFLTLRPGDTDDDYFANYTEEQLEYCRRYAESLSCEVQSRFGIE